MSQSQSHITPEQYQKYLKGELSAKEAYEIERILQSTPLYNDAMDGLEALEIDELTKDLDTLKQQIPLPASKNDKKQSWWRIAAMITLLIVGIPILWLVVDLQKPAFEGLSDTKKEDVFSTENSQNQSFQGNNLTEDTQADAKEKQESVLNLVDDQQEKEINEKPLVTKKPQKKIDLMEVTEEESGYLEPVAIATAPLPVIEEALIAEEELIEEIADDEELDYESTNRSYIADNARMAKTKEKEKLRRNKEKKTQQRSIDRSKNYTPAIAERVVDSTISSGQSAELKSFFVGDSSLKSVAFSFNITSPVPEGGQKSFEAYLKQNNVLVKKKRRYKSITLSFLVQPDSTTASFKLIEGDSLQFDSLEKIIMNGPKWVPVKNANSNQVRLILWKKTEKK